MDLLVFVGILFGEYYLAATSQCRRHKIDALTESTAQPPFSYLFSRPMLVKYSVAFKLKHTYTLQLWPDRHANHFVRQCTMLRTFIPVLSAEWTLAHLLVFMSFVLMLMNQSTSKLKLRNGMVQRRTEFSFFSSAFDYILLHKRFRRTAAFAEKIRENADIVLDAAAP